MLSIAYRALNRQKNRIGSRYGVEIPANVFDKGLKIYHFQNIIVNAGSKIGKNCSVIGNVCIGGKNGGKGAQIGDDCELGVFSAVIGDLVLGNNVKVGAGAIVTKSFPKDNIVLVGVPAREL